VATAGAAKNEVAIAVSTPYSKKEICLLAT
jgi:hypothetical protein